MAATERPLSNQELSEALAKEAKTVFNLLSNLREANKNEVFTSNSREALETDDDILILKRDPDTNRSSINKKAYLKLHRSLTPERGSAFDKIKEKYENTDDEAHDDSTEQIITVESLKNKYSPSGLGYAKPNVPPKPQPAPKPRRSKLSKSQIITPSKKEQTKFARRSLNIEKNKQKDVNSNNLHRSTDNLSEEEEDEFVTIITRSDSEESILKFQKELSAFTMDKKKRANSFRKIFSVFSNKDKKKKHEDKNKYQNKENGETYTDNIQNETNSFSRHSPYRHTTGGEAKPIKYNINNVNSDHKVPNEYDVQQLQKEYAQMHINQFNQFKHNFEKPDSLTKLTREGYTPMDKPIYKSNEPSNTYMNLPNKYIDTSSSAASTLESERSNIYQNEVLAKAPQPKEDEVEIRNYPQNSFRPSRITDNRRDTPPRLLETKQDVRLVNPKALIPINSERPLPNPYQNGTTESPVHSISRSKPLSQSTPTTNNINEANASRNPYLDDTYGRVFDSIEHSSPQSRNSEKVSRPPSVEPTKLRLPPNREIVPLSPRIRSPIPPDNVSTEKIIATELLKSKRSPTPTKKVTKEEIPSHQRLEIDIDYPEHINYVNNRNSLAKSTDNLISKPPVQKPLPPRRLPDTHLTTNDFSRISLASRSSNESVALRQRLSQTSPIDSPDRIITNAQVHTNSPINRTPTPNNSNSNQNLSLSPIRPAISSNMRPVTPSGSQIPESPKTTPQKEDIRKSVEAYYWKEIKKLKDQENYDMYLWQRQYGNLQPYGYIEEPPSARRSRSISPAANRNGRRSLSLPREVKQPANVIPENYYPNAIPENRVVTSRLEPRSVQQLQFQQQQQQQQQYFQRNTLERSTIDGSPRKYNGNSNSLYRPIFKRGSLSTPPRQMITEDSLKRKVSFSGAQDQNVQAWPTKNGYTQSPPQRRIDKLQSQGDDEVFLDHSDQYRYVETNNTKPDLPKEEMYITRQNVIAQNANVEPMYVLRANQNSLYLHQRQPMENPYGQRENPYGQKVNPVARRLTTQQEDILYGQPIDAVRPPVTMTRHGSIQIQEELYGQRQNPRRITYQNNIVVRPSVPSTPVSLGQEVQYISRRPASQQAIQPLRREIIVNDEIFGQFGGYNGNSSNNVRVVQPPPQNVYASRQSIAEYNSRVRNEYYSRLPPKQVSVSDKVCDMYGQIHDSDPRYQKNGVLMGQLHQNPGSPAVVRNSYTQLAGRENFVRNSRLTASANDMYRRVQMVPQGPQGYPNEALYGRIEQNGNGAPNRPLPPVPHKKGDPSLKNVLRNNMISDTESGSDASEVQRILNSKPKPKRRNIFGK